MYKSSVQRNCARNGLTSMTGDSDKALKTESQSNSTHTVHWLIELLLGGMWARAYDVIHMYPGTGQLSK